MNVLVVGATGFMGSETVRQLMSAGMQVRAISRTPEKLAGLRAKGIDIVQSDLIDPPSLARACEGMDAVIDAAHSLMGVKPYQSSAVDGDGQRALVDAAKAGGVKHFVFASMRGASANSPIDFIRYKALTEQHLQSSGMNYTILRLPAFMEWHVHNFLGKDILEKGKATILGKGEAMQNYISACDAAAFAVLSLTNPRACDRILEAGGLDNASKNQIAEMYIRLSGRDAKVGHMPPFLLRVMSVAMKPIKPEVAQIMQISYLDDQTSHPFDAAKLLAEFPVNLTGLEEFVRAQVEEWKATTKK